jgi:drug/metabolite transporter (DMT)-like permease
MWFILALVTALLWAVGQIFAKKGLAEISPLINNVLAAIFALVVWIPFTLIHGIRPEMIPSLLPIAILIAATYLSFYYAFEKGQVALSGTIIAMYPLTTVLLSAIFLHEQTSLFQKIAVGVIILGAVLIAMPSDRNIIQKFRLGTWVWWAVFAAVIMGIGDFLAKVSINRSDAYTFLFTLSVAYIPVILVNILIDPKGRKFPQLSWSTFLPAITGNGMIAIGYVTFNMAFSLGLASLVAPISSSYVAILAILALIFLKEKINRMQLFGILAAAVGVILLGVA